MGKPLASDATATAARQRSKTTEAGDKMAKPWTGITAGLLAGAAGATAKNAVSYLDQAATGDSPPSSPEGAAHAAQQTGDAEGRAVPGALGPLGGLGIGVGVGAMAGLIRGANATPPPVVAAIATGLVAMGIGEGLASVSGTSKPTWSSPTNLARDLLAHLAYGAVTGYALHRMLDPRTPVVSRVRLRSS